MARDPQELWTLKTLRPLDDSRVRVGEFFVPPKFVVSFTHQDLPSIEMEVDVDRVTRAVRCTRLSCVDETSQERVTGAKLRRLPLERMMRAALVDMAAEDSDGGLVGWHKASREQFIDSMDVQDPGARWSLTPDHLEVVAQVYREALGQPGVRPVQAVANHFGRPRSTAARWVAEARRANKLGPTTRGKAGERAPARKRTTRGKGRADG